jgi:putative ABC transport system permease protein
MSMKKNNSFALKLLLLSLLRRRSRILVALIGVAIGGTVLLGMITLSYDIPRQMSREFRAYGANLVFVASAGKELLESGDLARASRLLPPDKLVGLAPYRYETVRSNLSPYQAVGTSFEEVKKTSPYWRIDGLWPTRPGEILIGGDLAEANHWEPGRQISLDGRNRSQTRYAADFTITGLVRTGGVEDGFIFMDLGDMEKMTEESGQIEAAEVSLTADGQELAAIIERVRAGAPGVEPRLVKRVARSEETVLSKLKTLVYLVTLVVLVLTMICVATTMMTVVMERRREIGLKKALGAENKRIALEFLAEGLALGLLGGGLGCGGGLVFAQIISANVFHRSIAIEFYLIPLTLVVSAAVAIVACLIPVKRAVAVEPALVLRGE